MNGQLNTAALMGLILIFLVSCLAGITGCSRQAEPSLVLIIMDTTRADRLGYAGYDAASTSSLDSLAASGVHFTQAITATPVTGPAIATILSGTVPPVHGMRDNARFTLNPKLPLLAEIFQDAGYRTGAVVGAVPLLGRFGYARGFAHYDDDFAGDPYRLYNPAFQAKLEQLAVSERRGGPVTDHALAWLDGVKKGEAFFLLAHYFDPHGPYDPPPPYARRIANPYDAEIAYLDDEIGRLLAGVRQRFPDEDIRVVAMGDHGEGLGDHDEATHGFFLYDTTLLVPLIFSGTGAQRGLTVASAVGCLNLAPTLCTWLGVLEPGSFPETFHGSDFTPALTGGPVPSNCDVIYVETFLTQLRHDWSPLQGFRSSDWKWIKAPRPELYDLRADPQETTNLVQERFEVAEGIQGSLATWEEKVSRLARQYRATLTAEDPEISRQLDALGYVSSSKSPRIDPDYDLPDPKDGNREWNQQMLQSQLVAAAQFLAQEGQIQQALDKLTEANQINSLGREQAAFQGHLLEKLARYPEALRAYQSALATTTDPSERATIRLQIARNLLEMGRLQEAAAHCDTLRANPATPTRVHSGLAELENQYPDLR